MPPRRPTRGRHRKPTSHSGPAYVTAATLAAFAVSGVNVPGAIGDVRGRGSADPQTVRSQVQPARTVAAGQLRRTLVAQQAERTSRLRTARSTMVERVKGAVQAERKAREAARPKFVLPVDNFRLTAGFGDWGLWSSAHTGQDFAAPEGTPVRAIADGTVIFAAYDGAYGNKIVIGHPDGTVTWYAHLSAFLQTGGAVQAGDVIGRIGSTGHVTGPHLHFEVRPHDGAPVPPLTWLREHGLKV